MTKQDSKHALLTGTQSDSIARFLARELNAMGWHAWIYSRNAIQEDKGLLHVRSCDVTQLDSIEMLVNEMPQVDLAIQMADSGTAFGNLEDLSSSDIDSFVATKVTGSLLLAQVILKKAMKSNVYTKLVWAAGKPTGKDKNILLFGPVNSALLELVNELNAHYSEYLSAYYMVTGLILPSTQGQRYLDKCGSGNERADSPDVLFEAIFNIIKGNVSPGMSDTSREKLL